MIEPSTERQALPRSKRVARGFFRIAVVGLTVGIIAAIGNDAKGLRAHTADLNIQTPNGIVAAAQQKDDREISRGVVALAGPPKFDAYSPVSSDAFPYASQIAEARSSVASQIATAKDSVGVWTIFAAAWFAGWMIISWLVRGFMAD